MFRRPAGLHIDQLVLNQLEGDTIDGFFTIMLKHMRILEPYPGILAFYDGRVDGHRFMQEPNWVDGGAITAIPGKRVSSLQY